MMATKHGIERPEVVAEFRVEEPARFGLVSPGRRVVFPDRLATSLNKIGLDRGGGHRRQGTPGCQED